MKKTDELDEGLLWKNLRNGDEDAFSLLFKKYYGKLVHYGSSFSVSSLLVKDFVQDVFADIWLYRVNLPEEINIRAYLFASVRKRSIRFLERDNIFGKASSLEGLKLQADSLEEGLIAKEEYDTKVAHLKSMLETLPPRQREALYLRFNQEFSPEEIAKILDINYQSANNLIHRALQHLRRINLVSVLSILQLFQKILPFGEY